MFYTYVDTEMQFDFSSLLWSVINDDIKTLQITQKSLVIFSGLM